jgi:hypothetical protein
MHEALTKNASQLQFSTDEDTYPLLFFVANGSHPIRKMGFAANTKVKMTLHDIESCTFSSGFRQGLPKLLDSASDFLLSPPSL